MKESKKEILVWIAILAFLASTIGFIVLFWKEGTKDIANPIPETPILSTDSSQKTSISTPTPTPTPTNYTLTNNGDQGISVKLKTKNPLELNFPTTLSKPVSVLLAKNRTIKITQLKGKEFTLLPKEQTIKTDKNYKLLDIIKKDPLLVSYISKNNNLAFYTYQRIEDKNKRTLFKNWILFNTPNPTQTLNYRIDNAVVNIDSSGDAQVYFDTGKGKVSKISDFTIPRPYFLDKNTKKTNLNWKFNKSSHILSVTLSATPEQYPIALDPSVEKTDEVIATFSGKSIVMHMPVCGEAGYTVTGTGNDTNTYETVIAEDGNCWLKSNLGTDHVATAYNDSAAYGWLYQWGRLTDGHQIPTSGTTSTLSSTDVPGHSNFIIKTDSPYDWRSPQNDNLWQGVNGINNPCPDGFRLPTKDEWATLVSAAGITDSVTAFSSSLKLTVAGARNRWSDLTQQGSAGYYQSSTPSGISIYVMHFDSSSANPAYTHYRAPGFSVRCIKD